MLLQKYIFKNKQKFHFQRLREKLFAMGREMKNKGEKQRYIPLNAELQRIARRDKKAFLGDQCKERGKQNGKNR